MPLLTLNGEYVNKNQLSKKLYILRTYTCTVSKHYVSGLLDIFKKIIVVVISFKIWDFLDITCLLGFCFVNLYTFRRDLLSKVSFLYGPSLLMTFPFLGAVTGSKATSMVNDLAALILSKSQIGEEYQVSTEDIQVEIFLAQRSHDFCLSF